MAIIYYLSLLPLFELPGRLPTSIRPLNHVHAWEDLSGLSLMVATSSEAHHHRYSIDIIITISETQLPTRPADLWGRGTLRSSTVRTAGGFALRTLGREP
ncbi:hypothetical protein CRG98_032159 [Punica granatum]|uniref:Uncharacterized protein n=1 Tax=Punica granatum TaxID=22663 RepID=A0A2I0IUV4_PUNGR|nr:hypothetical protein CRG98_032159 [Punica granatum]